MYADFIKASLIRAIRTMAQAAGAQVLVNAGSGTVGIGDVDWKVVVSVAAVAGILSVLNSIVTGLPEVDGTLPIIERGKAE